MAENKMEQVAQMFGKKLNEDFKAVIWDSIVECRGEAKIVEDEK